MATKYTLQISGYVVNNETGATLLPSRVNYLAAAALDELLAGGCATEGKDGSVSLTPDGVLLDQITVPVQSLDDAKNDAYNEIDAAAGVARSRYLTIAPGQEAVYMAKSVQATDYKASGYDVTKINDYVWLVAECNSQSVDITDAAKVQAVVDGVLATQNAWYAVGSKIEEIRLGSKGKVSAETGTTDKQIQKAKANIIGYVADAKTQLEAV